MESHPTGEKNLQKLIAYMEPVLNPGAYVFVSLQEVDSIPRSLSVAEIREKEGITIVLEKSVADQRALTYDVIMAWITLNVHSALEAVGLTAAFAKALGDQQISCNVIAGFYHDHIFVPVHDADKAISALKELAASKA